MKKFKGLNLDAEYDDIRFVYESYIKLRKEDMLSSDDLLKIHELYSENKEDFARAILDTTLFQKMQNADSCIPTDREDVERYVPAFSKILDETLQEQGRRFGSFNLIYEGWYSNIFQIGNKILKVGVPRRTYEIPNHKRILQPFIRENFETKEGKPFACIELSQAVTAQKIMNYTVLYNIYKELRESGIVWGDAKAENIGILNDVNLPRYEKQLFQNIPEFVGIKGENKDAPLDIGDYVIIDTDFLYELDSNKKIEKDSGIYLLSHSENFETMYQTELKYKVRVNQYKNDEGR